MASKALTFGLIATGSIIHGQVSNILVGGLKEGNFGRDLSKERVFVAGILYATSWMFAFSCGIFPTMAAAAGTSIGVLTAQFPETRIVPTATQT